VDAGAAMIGSQLRLCDSVRRRSGRMNTRYHVTFTGWVNVNTSTPEGAAILIRNLLEQHGVTIMIEDIEEEQY
jgi:hypothetical protein